jgi:hypothetical protein
MLAKMGAYVHLASSSDFIADMFVAWPATTGKQDGTRAQKAFAAGARPPGSTWPLPFAPYLSSSERRC